MADHPAAWHDVAYDPVSLEPWVHCEDHPDTLEPLARRLAQRTTYLSFDRIDFAVCDLCHQERTCAILTASGTPQRQWCRLCLAPHSKTLASGSEAL